jgi:hypothetical protein
MPSKAASVAQRRCRELDSNLKPAELNIWLNIELEQRRPRRCWESLCPLLLRRTLKNGKVIEDLD